MHKRISTIPVENLAPNNKANKGIVPVFDTPMSIAQKKYNAQAAGDGIKSNALFHILPE
jgi:hypothetical protein